MKNCDTCRHYKEHNWRLCRKRDYPLHCWEAESVEQKQE